MTKKLLSSAALFLALSSSLAATDAPAIGAVNFASCISESKFGKREQESFENLRKQMSTQIESTEKQLKEIAAKFEDPEFLDSLSPKAEEELKATYQALQEEMGRNQNQFYQMLQHANYQMMQKMNNNITSAAEKVAKQMKFDYVINRELCFYIKDDYDITSSVITEMDKSFDVEMKSNKNVSENAVEIKAPAEEKSAN